MSSMNEYLLCDSINYDERPGEVWLVNKTWILVDQKGMYPSIPKHLFLFVIFQRRIYFSNWIYLNVTVCIQTDDINRKVIQGNLLLKADIYLQDQCQVVTQPEFEYLQSPRSPSLYLNFLISCGSQNCPQMAKFYSFFDICNNMDGLARYYAEWNKSDRERQILSDITYLESKNYNKLVHIAKKSILTNSENKLVVTSGETEGD